MRKFAFQYAIANDVVVLKCWVDHEMATYAWLKGFIHHHKELSLRSPQATSLGRATAFNKTAVAECFYSIKEVPRQYSIQMKQDLQHVKSKSAKQHQENEEHWLWCVVPLVPSELHFHLFFVFPGVRVA
ncbi:hypothetical protein PR048_005286 [Dryococelus australis]|uniref:Transposase n=1 Tax=Dryococelus australis TaxID=614101 RepID=A0ABQ9I8X0_9NEOP|nr:hypothetical protein PR048_005286 [Dryococelus australis]